MSTAVSFHPPKEQLLKFVEGELAAGLSVALSAHIEICEDCQRLSAELESQVIENWDASITFADDADVVTMLDQIVSREQETSLSLKPAMSRELVIHDRHICLPVVLAKIAAAGLTWKNLGGGISQALVKIDDRTKCEFIYMTPGSKAPQHTHCGNEVMLVLDGTFCDELGEYHAADFVMRDPSHQHQPRTEVGCLCFSVLDSPLLFTKGPLRFLNPFNRLMFWKSQWFR